MHSDAFVSLSGQFMTFVQFLGAPSGPPSPPPGARGAFEKCPPAPPPRYATDAGHRLAKEVRGEPIRLAVKRDLRKITRHVSLSIAYVSLFQMSLLEICVLEYCNRKMRRIIAPFVTCK